MVTETTPARRWWLLGVLGGLLIAPGLAMHRASAHIDSRWLLIIFGALSLFTLMAYAADKARAKAEEWRVSEWALHGLELSGGWPGALLAQVFFRHKTAKATYQLVFWLIIFLHQLIAFDYALGWVLVRALFGK